MQPESLFKRMKIRVKSKEKSGRIYMRHFQQLLFQIVEQYEPVHSHSFFEEQMLDYSLNIVLLLLLRQMSIFPRFPNICCPFLKKYDVHHGSPLGQWDVRQAGVMQVTSREKPCQPVCALPGLFFLCNAIVNVLQRLLCPRSEGDMASPQGMSQNCCC